MENFNLQLADRLFRIQCQYHSTYQFCKEYVCTDSDEKITDKSSLYIQQQEIEFERRKSELEDKKEGIPIRHFSDEYLETLAVYRKIAEQMIEYDTLLFHGSVVAVDGVGYLFTAKSGTGKSTHTKLWREAFGNRAVMVNDDKPLLHIAKNGVKAYGTPWDGKHRLSSNIAVPLKAISILNRDKTNHIEQISREIAYPLLLQQTYRSTDARKLALTLKLLDLLLQNVPLYSLGCNMEPEAAMVAFQGMNEKKDGGKEHEIKV